MASKLKFKPTVSGVGIVEVVTDVVEDFDIWFKSDGVVEELCICGDESKKNGLDFVDVDGSDDGVLGEVDRLRVGNIRFVIGFKIDDDDDDDAVVGFPLVSFGSIGILSRDCLDNEDIRRLAAAIGPIDKQSVRVLVFFSLEFVDSSLEDDSSLLDIQIGNGTIIVVIVDCCYQ
jgi:hypothetical protein